jgi:hypothetical protein
MIDDSIIQLLGDKAACRGGVSAVMPQAPDAASEVLVYYSKLGTKLVSNLLLKHPRPMPLLRCYLTLALFNCFRGCC